MANQGSDLEALLSRWHRRDLNYVEAGVELARLWPVAEPDDTDARWWRLWRDVTSFDDIHIHARVGDPLPPDQLFRVYRAQPLLPSGPCRGISWFLNPSDAATRYHEKRERGYLVGGEVSREHIVSYIDSTRGEVIVEPEAVRQDMVAIIEDGEPPRWLSIEELLEDADSLRHIAQDESGGLLDESPTTSPDSEIGEGEGDDEPSVVTGDETWQPAYLTGNLPREDDYIRGEDESMERELDEGWPQRR